MLQHRSDFLRVGAPNRKYVTTTFILLIAPRATDVPGVGFTVTRKLGGAVIRNRIRRRLREGVRAVAAQIPQDCDMVLIARSKAHGCAFTEIVRDMQYVFAKVARENKKDLPA